MRYVRQYDIPEVYKAFVDMQVLNWNADGVVEVATSSSKWNSPILTVPKYLPSGEIDKPSRRVCLDARFVNEALISDDRFPVPIIVDIYADTAGSSLFAEMDCYQAYTQFEIAPESRKYLSFTWRGDQLQIYESNLWSQIYVVTLPEGIAVHSVRVETNQSIY